MRPLAPIGPHITIDPRTAPAEGTRVAFRVLHPSRPDMWVQEGGGLKKSGFSPPARDIYVLAWVVWEVELKDPGIQCTHPPCHIALAIYAAESPSKSDDDDVVIPRSPRRSRNAGPHKQMTSIVSSSPTTSALNELPKETMRTWKNAINTFAARHGDQIVLLDAFPSDNPEAKRRAWRELKDIHGGTGITPHAYVHYISRYFPKSDETASGLMVALLTRIPAVAINGDGHIELQNGQMASSYMAAQESADGTLLSYDERKLSRKKLIITWSLVRKIGGYPKTVSKAVELKQPFMCGIISFAGAQFEMPELEASLFLQWPSDYDGDRPDTYSAMDTQVFGHLYGVRGEKPPVVDSKLGAFAVLQSAFYRSATEDWALIFLAASDLTERVGGTIRPTCMIKLAALGLGFFAKRWPEPNYKGRDLAPVLAPILHAALTAVLRDATWDRIGRIELPDFFPTRLWTPDWVMNAVNGVALVKTGKDVVDHRHVVEVTAPHPPRDLLEFTNEELVRFVPIALNPSDVFALVGNERGYDSVEAMIANNSSARADGSYQHNPWLLSKSRHVRHNVRTLNP